MTSGVGVAHTLLCALVLLDARAFARFVGDS